MVEVGDSRRGEEWGRGRRWREGWVGWAGSRVRWIVIRSSRVRGLGRVSCGVIEREKGEERKLRVAKIEEERRRRKRRRRF